MIKNIRIERILDSVNSGSPVRSWSKQRKS